MTDREPTFRDVFVTSVMTESIETIAGNASATTAAKRLSESDIGSLLVDDQSCPPTGIVTESDFVELAAAEQNPKTTSVTECMSSPVVTIPPSASIGEAAEKMAEHDVKKLPIVDEEAGDLVGIVTTTDIAKYVPVHKFHPEDSQ